MDAQIAKTLYPLHRTLDLARCHLDAGRYDVARKICQNILEVQAENLEAPCLLARIAAAEGDYVGAADLFVATLTPSCEEVLWEEYYSYLNKAGKRDQAVVFFRDCVQRKPESCRAWFCLAQASLAMQDRDAFLQAASRLERLSVGDHRMTYNLANLYGHFGLVVVRERCLRRCMELAPGLNYYCTDLANILKITGRADEAHQYYRRMVLGQAGDMPDHLYVTNYLMNLICMTRLTPEEIYTEFEGWGKKYCSFLQTAPFQNSPEPDKKLRIGYVSTDFRRHPVVFFIEPLLSLHDQNRFEIYLYSAVEQEDYITEQIRLRPCTWRTIADLDDERADALVREDRIDILVDLGGFTKGNRLKLFARKPAPVQVTWLGFAHSTGFPSIDYRFSDAVADPPGMTEPLHTEQLYRLPDCFLSYHPPLDPPACTSLPALSNNFITFAAFNDLAKMNDALLEWWASILKLVPDSRIMMKNELFQRDETFRLEWLDRFAALGITSNRIDLPGHAPDIHSHLARIAGCDIALDSYPYNGTTTTCETVLMGVPVITLAGPSHRSRVSASLLSVVGVPELIAETPEQYIQLAVSLAHDVERLNGYRTHLRNMMQSSALMDFAGFTGKIEKAYRDIWQQWCLKEKGNEARATERGADE